MNIVHIIHGKANPKGHNGISRVVYYLNKHEKLQGENSRIWSLVDKARRREIYKRDEYVTVEIFPRVTLWNIHGKESMITALREEKENIDILHLHLIWFLDKNVIAREMVKSDLPFVITTHGTYNTPHARTGKRLLAKWIYEVKYLNMASEIHALQYEESYGNTKYGVKVPQFILPNGIEENEISEERDAHYFDHVKNGRLVIFWIGVFRSDKNLEQLLLALTLLQPEERGRLLLVLAGPDNKGNKKKLKALCHKHGITPHVLFEESAYGQKKYNMLESSDIYIMPSLSEGISMSILDALACGKPCVLTRQCGFEYYTKYDFFEMCEPYAGDLARAIRALLNHPERREQMGIRAREMISVFFSWENIAGRMTENYARIIKEHKGEGHKDVGE